MSEDPAVQPAASPKDKPEEETVWNYRGYHLRPGEFTTAMVHLYRGEIGRSNVWRQRLDATTNWAVGATGAAISIAFGDPLTHHSLILLSALLITAFLVMESYRYRYYALWAHRTRLMEVDFYAAMFTPPYQPGPTWGNELSENLVHPKFTISFWRALGRRLGRAYGWLYTVLALAWVLKLSLHPTLTSSFSEIVGRASILGLPGGLVLGLAAVIYLLMLAAFIRTFYLEEVCAEELQR